MAAPPEINIKNLTGKWVISKSLSDSTDPVLALQGIGWLTRKAISLATITQHLKMYEAPPESDPSGAPTTHIDIDQRGTGGLKGTTEKRNLDYQWRPHSDYLFGDVRGKTRWVKLEDIVKEKEGGEQDLLEDAKFLVEGWDEETRNGELVDSFVENEDRGWTAWQIWGFATVDGKRMLTRRFAVRKGKEVERIRLVYEYAGKLDS
ncbi:hypothetical protein K469DRAFT_628626 [Zopfia rhizophila CBS 207.26]|uniref:Lipocalin-like domain-containing protein n=1 Tax=Zopfia rhizophila CBS 207.26 TaxID=1314779 RepID=A0A6A6E9J4_9PEZI|nr:hypothetical protein K469DRAFT_628626 [Zopfia rhizophila CBS 207.26]